jgi:perosamine synthetase
MTDLQAALGIVQLGRLDAFVARRREIATRYQQMLAHIPGLRCVTDPSYGRTNYQSFWLELSAPFPADRDQALAILAGHGISARRGIMSAHRQPAYAGHSVPPLPATDYLTERSLILPIFHAITETEQARVVEAVCSAAQGVA